MIDASAADFEAALPSCVVEVLDLPSRVSVSKREAVASLCEANIQQGLRRDFGQITARCDPGFWWLRRSAEHLTSSDETMTAHSLVPLSRLDAVVQAGGRCIYPSMRAILGDQTDDETGFTVDVACVEGNTRGGQFAGFKVTAASYRWEGVTKRRVQC